MSASAIFLLAVGLAMDAMAASATQGLRAAKVLPRHVLWVALLFGGFQALMPLLGFALGHRLGPAVAAWDHWLAFGLLGGIGGKMLWDAMASSDADDEPAGPAFEPKVLLGLAVATSIDALAAGVTLPVLGAPLLQSLLIIGLTTAVLSAVGVLLGRRFGKHASGRLDVIGGVVLIGMGTKVLVDHLGLF